MLRNRFAWFDLAGRVFVALPDKVIELEAASGVDANEESVTLGVIQIDGILRGARVRRLGDVVVDPAATPPPRAPIVRAVAKGAKDFAPSVRFAIAKLFSGLLIPSHLERRCEVKQDTAALTRREREIMNIIHRRGRATAQEVLEELSDPPSYSAVRTLLRLLEERGHVKHAQDGPRYVYTPTVTRREARRSALLHVVRTFFDGSAPAAMAALVETSKNKLSKTELEELAELIEKAKKEGR